MSEWRVEATSLGGTPIDVPVDYDAAVIDGEWNAGRFASITLPAIAPAAFPLVSQVGQHLLSVWTPDNDIIFHGQTWGLGGDSEGASETVTLLAADPWANAARRMTNRIATQSFSAEDQGDIVATLFDDSGVRVLIDPMMIEATVNRDRSWADNPIAVADAVSSFTRLIDPIDIYLDPIAYDAGKIVVLRITSRDNPERRLVLARGHGTIDNAPQLTVNATLDRVTNELEGIGAEGATPVVETDGPSIADFGYLGEVRTWGSVSEADTLEAHVLERIAQWARPVFKFSAGGELADQLAFVDFWPGDLAQCVLTLGGLKFSDEPRVMGAQLTIDAAGPRTTSVTLDEGDATVEEEPLP